MSTPLEHRLRRNVARLAARFEREGVDCWRVYDRDIPEVPWTIDVYAGRVLATEFVTPVARRRGPEARRAEQAEVLGAVERVLGAKEIVTASREPAATSARAGRGGPGAEFEVREGPLRFLVSLRGGADTGLFADQREARRRLLRGAAGLRVLNLFCYTGSFNVAAGAGGAAGIVGVDLSRTYLDWARRNLALNGLDAGVHRLVRADVFEYLRAGREDFDVVVLDPPTVSRSAAGRSFDVQRAHPLLVRLAAARLAPGGVLEFSTNFKHFRLEERSLAGLSVRETTSETTPPDFREGAHRSWEIRR